MEDSIQSNQLQAVQVIVRTPNHFDNQIQPEEQIKEVAKKAKKRKPTFIVRPGEKQTNLNKTIWHIIWTCISSCLCIDGCCQTYHTFDNVLCCWACMIPRMPFWICFYPCHFILFVVLALAIYYFAYTTVVLFVLMASLPLNLFCCLGVCCLICCLPSIFFFGLLPCNCLGCVPGCGAFNLICPCSVCLCPCFNTCLPLPCFCLDVPCMRCLHVCPCLPCLNVCCPLPTLHILLPCTLPCCWWPFFSCVWCCTVLPFYTLGACVIPCGIAKFCSVLDCCWAPWCVLCCSKNKVFKRRVLDEKMIQETKSFLKKMKLITGKDV